MRGTPGPVRSLLAYSLFGVHGRSTLERYGHLIHVSPRTLSWGEAAFHRYGESSVFWGRLLPVVRAAVSVPAGLAGMDRTRFVLYSAAGAVVFDTALTYLVYTGSAGTSPLGVALASAGAVGRTAVVDVQSHVPLVATLVLLTVAVGVLLVVAGGDRRA